MIRAIALLLLVGCAGTTPPPSTPTAATPIGASDELRAEDERAQLGHAGALFADMPEADLTTEEGRGVLRFSAPSVMAIATFTMILGGVGEMESNACREVVRTEVDGTVHVEVRANDCPSPRQEANRMTGHLVFEQRETECGSWASITFDPWELSDERMCGATNLPRGVRRYQGTVTTDECAGTVDVDLVIGGEGAEQVRGECQPMDQMVVRYLLENRGAAGENAPVNGRGEVGLVGVGRASIETIDEVIVVEGCNKEAASGLTRARAGGHVAEVRYDGATECTDPPSAPLFLDGQPAGSTEHACSASGSGPAPFVPIGLLWLGWRLRQRRTTHSS